MNLFFDADIHAKVNHFLLNEKESAHAIKVLRMQKGQNLYVTNGKGYMFKCIISGILNKQIELQIEETEFREAPKTRIHMAVSPLKLADRFEWFLEKAVEAGVSEITPISCHRTEKKKVREDRLFKVAESALKQSLNFYFPVINPVVGFQEFAMQASSQNKFICYCETENEEMLTRKLSASTTDVLIAIGPEGDFTQEEVGVATENGFAPVSLGENRYRTETAALASVFFTKAISSLY